MRGAVFQLSVALLNFCPITCEENALARSDKGHRNCSLATSLDRVTLIFRDDGCSNYSGSNFDSECRK